MTEEQYRPQANRESLKNKRIAALDFGRKRIGLAVCDELHITVSTRETMLYADTEEFWQAMRDFAAKERIGAFVLGVPYRLDGEETPVIKQIFAFRKKLQENFTIPVFEYDESYSTVRAYSTMHEIGMKKKKRQDKSTKDALAAAVILRDFLDELH